MVFGKDFEVITQKNIFAVLYRNSRAFDFDKILYWRSVHRFVEKHICRSVCDELYEHKRLAPIFKLNVSYFHLLYVRPKMVCLIYGVS
jgi:hypothetical protein